MSSFHLRIINSSLNNQRVLFIFKRFKSKAQIEKQSSPCTKALKHFDDFYKAVFAERWHSVRLGLLTQKKYFAVLNNFGDIKETEENLKNQGAFSLREFLEVQKKFVEDLNEENVEKEGTKLGDIIQKQLLQEEEKESELLHPEGLDFKAKADYYAQQNEGIDVKGSYVPEDAGTSLESDLKLSEIDESRLILPDSVTDAAMLHEFIPATQLRGAEGFIAESDYYKYYKVKSSLLFNFEEEHELDFPEDLKVYTFDRGEVLDFPEPKKGMNNVYSYLKIDGSDLLAALALDVKPSDAVLDLCSTSGNISYCIFQTLRPKILLCTNDVKSKALNLFNLCLDENEALWGSMLHVSSSSIDESNNECLFDKVLVDVPSTFDRTSLFEETDNIFHVTKLKQRLKLPETQCSSLLKGMKLVRPGGTVLYTTSTLSPVQNEGVVNEALQIIWEEEKLRFTVKKLTPALRHTTVFFNYGDYLGLKFGTLVVPFVPSNFGPRYICKIVRDEEQDEGNAGD